MEAQVYDKYFTTTHEEDHEDAALFLIELNNIPLRNSKEIDISERVAKIKARLHGRQSSTLLRAKLSERWKTMQYSMSINKLKKVVQMIIPKDRAALDYASIGGIDGEPVTMEMADMEANRVMKKWMAIPSEMHYISQDFF